MKFPSIDVSVNESVSMKRLGRSCRKEKSSEVTE